MDIRKVKKLIELLETSGVNEIEIKEGDQSVRIQRAGLTNAAPVEMAQPAVAVAPTPTSTEADSENVDAMANEEAPEGITVVKAPMVGTYYSAAAPGEKPFTAEGQKVAVGDTLCILEAMKTMNQLKAPVAGTITKIHATNGDPVEYNQVLVDIRTE